MKKERIRHLHLEMGDNNAGCDANDASEAWEIDGFALEMQETLGAGAFGLVRKVGNGVVIFFEWHLMR